MGFMSLLGVGQPPAAGGGAFTCDAVTFDGTNDYLTRGADLTGNADGRHGMCSFWIKADPANFTDGYAIVYIAVSDRMDILIFSDGTVYCYMQDSTGLSSLSTTTTLTIQTNSWSHVGIWWDTDYALNSKILEIYIDNTLDTNAPIDTGALAFDIDYTQTEHWVGAYTDATGKINGDFAEFYLNFATGLDLGVASNMEKFRTSGGKPVDLGSDGSRATGTAPIIYLHVGNGGATSDFVSNDGSGGGMTENGALAIAATSPSD